MSVFSSSFYFLFLFSFLTSFRASAEAIDNEPLFDICPDTSIYSTDRTYFNNLQTLLSSLSSPNASYSSGFQTATAGENPDKVTGLFLCRGDLSSDDCRRWVDLAVKDTRRLCPNAREVTLYYDKCMLRYSNKSILDTQSTGEERLYANGQNVTSDEQERFGELVMSTINSAAEAASKSPRRFDARKANITFPILYVLVQCTPDLKSQECLMCLQMSFNHLPTHEIGGRILMQSCNSRFEQYKFFDDSAIPPSSPPGKGGNSTKLVVAIVVPIIVVVLLFIAGYCFLAKRSQQNGYHTSSAFEGDGMTTAESLQLDYRTIQTATNDFAVSNKIGQGGFGEVYKGTLLDGKEIAVKKLSKSSGQGEAEFKNEVVLVAKLQHRNLVKLLGFCLYGEERVLVYEYVPNKSLDYFLFDPAKQVQLDWTRRYKIINGVSRGIMYLHQDSRLTIIHRDLKASNILLDTDMSPKIADFGMARIFGLDQTQENTSRIVGTFGYMSPEYAMHGQYSMKSDVYSFGVLVLEIISGKKISNCYQTDSAHDLVSYAWKLWRNGTPLELMDPAIADNCQRNEVVRCVHIGLLCVQEDPAERPTMSNIVLMLTSNSVTLPVPLKPGLFIQSRPERDQLDSDTMSKYHPGFVDDASIIDLYPR